MSLASRFIGKPMKFTLGGTAMTATITDAAEVTPATNANKALDAMKKSIKANETYLVLVIKQ